MAYKQSREAVVNTEPQSLEVKLGGSIDIVKVQGETSKTAIVNTSPTDNIVNTITVDEVKELVDEKAGVKDAATAWEKAISPYLIQNGTTTEVGGNIEIDGKIKTDAVTSIVNTDDKKLFFSGTLAQYNTAWAAGDLDTNCISFITD